MTVPITQSNTRAFHQVLLGRMFVSNEEMTFLYAMIQVTLKELFMTMIQTNTMGVSLVTKLYLRVCNNRRDAPN